MALEFEYFKNIKMSPMEMVLSGKLKKEGIIFYQEVMFDGCINPNTGYKLRYDFFIPKLNMLVEYDGKTTHDGSAKRSRDHIKDRFAKDNGIKLIRITGLDAINSFVSAYISRGVRKRAKSRIKFIIKNKCAEPTAKKNKIKNKKPLGLVLPAGMTESEYRTKQAKIKEMKAK